MALIAMAVYDTEENKRSYYTKRTLDCILNTVDFKKHRIIIVDNNSCQETKFLINNFFLEKSRLYGLYDANPESITMGDNVGTAAAINEAWKYRGTGEHALKMDNDVIIHQNGWLDELEEAICRDEKIGICGLKRKDCWENPDHESEFYRSTLYSIPHKPGDRWIIGEEVNHVMGTCQLYSSALLYEIGYLYQPRLYGFDDVFAAIRCKMAGFKNVFLPHIHIDHIDAGGGDYQKWKEDHVRDTWAEFGQIKAEFHSGKRSIYYNPFTNEA